MQQDLCRELAYAVVDAGEASLRSLGQAVGKGRLELLAQTEAAVHR